MRQRKGNASGKSLERQGQVPFINADLEYFEGRAQNYLLREHIEKIVNTFENFKAEPGFSAIVSAATLRENDNKLNIRRYVDNAPQPEPHDVGAHLLGGVPKAEVAAMADFFAAHGLDPLALLTERDANYFDFALLLSTRQSIKLAIETNPGLVGREQAVPDAFDEWWQSHSPRITAIAGEASMVGPRNDLLHSVAEAAGPRAAQAHMDLQAACAPGNLCSRGAEEDVYRWREFSLPRAQPPSRLVDESIAPVKLMSGPAPAANT